MGVFRSLEQPSYDSLVTEQVERAMARGAGDLASIVGGRETWEVS
jgi:2-oxoglutarate ferredoxin oxidoreductase subunit beta